MHTTPIRTSEGKEFYFTHNGDYSGDIIIREPAYQDILGPDNEVTIPGEALIMFLGYIAGGALASFGEAFDLKEFLEKYT